MAFVGAGRDGLARQLWPQDSGVLLQDAHLDGHTISSDRVVPSELDELADWMFVELDADGQRGKVYVKGDGEGKQEPSELVLRLQGIVHDMNLTMMGTWDRTEVNAKKAVQHLSLVSGGCMPAFEPQWNALANIREMVSLMLGLSSSGRRTRPGTIHLRRRVFTKVASTDVLLGASVVDPGEDPSGVLGQMSARWRIASRLRAGDLVDVSVSVSVVLRKTPFGRKCDVFFEPCTVVHLRVAGCMKSLLRPREERRAPQVTTMRTHGKMAEGFSFRAGPNESTSGTGPGRG